MGVLKDLRGRQFGRLRVKHFRAIRHGHAYWCCKCECGAAVSVRGSRLLSGRIVSCGCQRSNPDIRRAARMVMTAEARSAAASSGGFAKAAAGKSCKIIGDEPIRDPDRRRDYGLTVDNAADALGVHKDSVWSMMNRGIIAFKVGKNGQARVSRADIEALIEQQPVNKRWKKRNECK